MQTLNISQKNHSLTQIVLWIHFSQTDKKILQKDNGYIYFALQHESSPFTAYTQQLVNFKKELQNADCFQY